MYVVKASWPPDEEIELGPVNFPSLDMARGFAIAAARWMRAVSHREGQIEILSNGDRIEGATFAYWAGQEFLDEDR